MAVVAKGKKNPNKPKQKKTKQKQNKTKRNKKQKKNATHYWMNLYYVNISKQSL